MPAPRRLFHAAVAALAVLLLAPDALAQDRETLRYQVRFLFADGETPRPGTRARGRVQVRTQGNVAARPSRITLGVEGRADTVVPLALDENGYPTGTGLIPSPMDFSDITMFSELGETMLDFSGGNPFGEAGSGPIVEQPGGNSAFNPFPRKDRDGDGQPDPCRRCLKKIKVRLIPPIIEIEMEPAPTAPAPTPTEPADPKPTDPPTDEPETGGPQTVMDPFGLG